MTFALITEGVSEHRIIKHIVVKYFKDKNPDINQIQPKIVNEKQVVGGGWNEVLEYCKRDELKDIFVENDYLIIQIDSDQSQQNPFNVSHTNVDGKMKSDEELYNDILIKLENLIKPEIKASFGDKIFFAICIHTIECWLLPLYYTNNQKLKTNNCLAILNTALPRNNIHIITPKNKNKSNGIKAYDSILSNMKKKTEINSVSQHNMGFDKFIGSIKKIG